MPRRDIIVIGASAGGIEPLKQLVGALPPDLPASLFVVVHFPPNGTSVLPQILNRARTLHTQHAVDGDPIQHGRVYVAQPDRHLLLQDGRMRLVLQPRENRHRPAVDPLFRSAALNMGPRVVSVVLSGSLDDGTSGTLMVKACGGTTVAQDPAEAIYADMPRSAIENAGVDYVLPVQAIAELLVRLSTETIDEAEMAKFDADTQQREQEVVRHDIAAQENGERVNQTTTMTCPECGGVLWEFDEGELIRFRCHVGHNYSAESMFTAQGEALEAALWTAMRALEESAMLSRRLATRARRRGRGASAGQFAAQAQNAEKRADLIRDVLRAHKSRGDLPEPAVALNR